jgi:hypothetical protein
MIPYRGISDPNQKLPRLWVLLLVCGLASLLFMGLPLVLVWWLV